MKCGLRHGSGKTGARTYRRDGGCSICGGIRETASKRLCRSCAAAYMRGHRPRHTELTEAQRLRENARSYANVYQKRGKLLPHPCESCHAPIAEKHHDDYAKPLDVRWLCRRCHLSEHAAAIQTRNPR